MLKLSLRFQLSSSSPSGLTPNRSLGLNTLPFLITSPLGTNLSSDSIYHLLVLGIVREDEGILAHVVGKWRDDGDVVG